MLAAALKSAARSRAHRRGRSRPFHHCPAIRILLAGRLGPTQNGTAPTMTSDDPNVRLKAFVGRSFVEADEALWAEFRPQLEALRSLGFVFEDAKEAQPRPVSEKVKQGIDRNDVCIGIVSCRQPVLGSSAVLARFRPVLDL